MGDQGHVTNTPSNEDRGQLDVYPICSCLVLASEAPDGETDVKLMAQPYHIDQTHYPAGRQLDGSSDAAGIISRWPRSSAQHRTRMRHLNPQLRMGREQRSRQPHQEINNNINKHLVVVDCGCMHAWCHSSPRMDTGRHARLSLKLLMCGLLVWVSWTTLGSGVEAYRTHSAVSRQYGHGSSHVGKDCHQRCSLQLALVSKLRRRASARRVS